MKNFLKKHGIIFCGSLALALGNAVLTRDVIAGHYGIIQWVIVAGIALMATIVIDESR